MSTRPKCKKFQMRVTLMEREELRIAAALSGLTVVDYIWGLHYARQRGEIMPGGARIIKSAMELAEAAEFAAKELSIAGRANPEFRQKIINLKSVIAEEGRPLPPVQRRGSR